MPYFIPLVSNMENIKECRLGIYGYPQAKYNRVASLHEGDSVVQWGLLKVAAVQNINYDKEQIVHKISTMPGQNGAPILAIDSYERVSIVGLHRGGLKR